MPSPFAAQSMPLGQLFANPYLVQAPPYQRSFAWTHEEAGRLLEDIAAALEADGETGDGGDYFLGTMLFIEQERSVSRLATWKLGRTARVHEVVDGLQRLTTLTILFSVLRDLDDADGERPNERPNERLMAAIGNGPGTSARQRLELREPDETFFHAHVRRRGATRVEPTGDKLSPAEARIFEVRQHLLDALADLDATQRRRLADFLFDKCHIVLVSTAGIDRAHRMFTVLNATGKPLARNDILKADLLGSVPAASLERATGAWDDAQTRLGGEFESLFSHLRTIYSRSSAHVISSVMGIASQHGGAATFVEGILGPAAAVFDDILHARHAGSPHSPAIAASLKYLGWLKGSDWVPPAVLWWLGKGKDPAELAWFLAALDRLAYGLRLLGLGTRRRANRLGAIVHAIRLGQDLESAGSPLRLTRDELRTIHHNLRDLHARSAPMAKLVLLRINDLMAGRPQNLAGADLTVEHLLPRKPGVNSSWRVSIPDPTDRDRCTESLGNLVLMTRAQNDKAGNLDFPKKKTVLFQAGAAASLPINDYVRRQSDWTAPQIREREAELLRHLDTLWEIGAPPRPPQNASQAAPSKRQKEPQAAGA